MSSARPGGGLALPGRAPGLPGREEGWVPIGLGLTIGPCQRLSVSRGLAPANDELGRSTAGRSKTGRPSTKPSGGGTIAALPPSLRRRAEGGTLRLGAAVAARDEGCGRGRGRSSGCGCGGPGSGCGGGCVGCGCGRGCGCTGADPALLILGIDAGRGCGRGPLADASPRAAGSACAAAAAAARAAAAASACVRRSRSVLASMTSAQLCAAVLSGSTGSMAAVAKSCASSARSSCPSEGGLLPCVVQMTRLLSQREASQIIANEPGQPS